MFKVPSSKIIVSNPNSEYVPNISLPDLKSDVAIFFYPTIARPFKNFEVIAEAAILLKDKLKDKLKFKIIVTINGDENNYAKRLVENYSWIPEINFVGLISRDEVSSLYEQSSCLIFPSTLETWGLPISEFKHFNKPMFISDLPYAIETVGSYEKAVFFDPNNPSELAILMEMLINREPLPFSCPDEPVYSNPHSRSWKELFNILLNY